ncbi:DUF7521 family protein [Haloarcula amylovorans]|uniref:DUF7521 family protein n=1 Tax=Haloarcula amylovorans TaxID=2562280 RepID=UPI001076AEA7
MISLPIIVIKLITLLLSFSVAYLAFYAYQRSDSSPMFYVAVGFVFIGVGAICEGLVYSVLGTSLFSAAVVQAVLVSFGMLLILRSILAGSETQDV